MQLANANIARIVHESLDAPAMHGFTSRLAAINALAERSPGFVWRLTDETGGGATGVDVFADDPKVIINMSVWESVETLHDFTYRTVHAKLIGQRANWFEPVAGTANLALWWVADGHRPTVAEALDRMRTLHVQGPSPRAFDFKLLFDAQGRPVAPDLPARECA